MSTVDPALRQIKDRAFALRLPMYRVMREANMAPSTWSRWMAGTVPGLGSIRAVEAALGRLEEMK